MAKGKDKKPRPKHYKSQEPDPPTDLDEEKKRSPNSLRRVFNAIRQVYPGGPFKHPAFLKRLDSAWKRDGCRYRVPEVTGQVFRAAEDGSAPLMYWHMESYANLLGVPSAAFLLISRLTMKKPHVSDNSAKQKKETDAQRAAAIATARGMRALLDGFENRVALKDIIDDQDIAGLIDDYLVAVGEKALLKS